MYSVSTASILRPSVGSTPWSTFLKAHWESIAATDFFTVEVFTLRGLVTHYVLFILDLASRTVKIAGITTHPHEGWMIQMARNLTDAEEPFLRRSVLDHGSGHEVFRDISRGTNARAD